MSTQVRYTYGKASDDNFEQVVVDTIFNVMPVWATREKIESVLSDEESLIKITIERVQPGDTQ